MTRAEDSTVDGERRVRARRSTQRKSTSRIEEEFHCVPPVIQGDGSHKARRQVAEQDRAVSYPLVVRDAR